MSRDLAFLLASVPVAVALAAAAGSGWPGIMLAGTAAWLFLVRHRRRPRARLVGALLLWAAALSASVATATALAPERASVLVPHGAAYWNDEMRPWLATGEGKESDPSRFAPEHALHLALFVVLAAATGGWAALVLGAWLLGYMSFYVGHVAASAAHPLLAGVLAWSPWSVLRVVAFVVLGVALARLVLDRMPPRAWWRAERRAVALGMALWVADLVVKTLLAPHWPAVISLLR